jgi:hypothetical protein
MIGKALRVGNEVYGYTCGKFIQQTVNSEHKGTLFTLSPYHLRD